MDVWNRLPESIIFRLSIKFLINLLLKMPPYLKYVIILPGKLPGTFLGLSGHLFGFLCHLIQESLYDCEDSAYSLQVSAARTVNALCNKFVVILCIMALFCVWLCILLSVDTSEACAVPNFLHLR